jgi:F-type H+-transporting ATPase subunit a
VILGLEFPPISHVTNWPEFALKNSEYFGINKVVLIYGFAVLFTFLIFIIGNKKQLVPTGAQNLAEISVEFIEDSIVMETIGPKGVKYTPLLMSFFFFVFFTNIFEIVPFIQMPATARIALPLFLALFAYVVYHGAGFIEHGPLGYLKHALIVPDVPVAMHLLLVPIEFVSKFLVQPFSHAVRLFANLLAGHILLVTFATLSSALWAKNAGVLLLPLPAAAVVAFTAFELMVSFLQAYVFTLLAGVYIGAAISHDH